MAERARFSAREIIVGIVVLAAAFLVIFLLAGALSLNIPQWLLGAVAAVIGVMIWFALIGRLRRR